MAMAVALGVGAAVQWREMNSFRQRRKTSITPRGSRSIKWLVNKLEVVAIWKPAIKN
jgi:hypothetical protein